MFNYTVVRKLSVEMTGDGCEDEREGEEEEKKKGGKRWPWVE